MNSRREAINTIMNGEASLFYISSREAQKLNRFFQETEFLVSDFGNLGEIICVYDHWVKNDNKKHMRTLL